ncbi:hypothetical protein KA005_81320 [bacterium]|nr:hypothetical protein [bacterium]
MANTDRPNGFRPVKTLSGAPVASVIRSVGVADAADIFAGDALQLASGLAQPLAVEGVCLGVAVGFGKVNDLSQKSGGPFNPDDLMTRYYDDSASTHTEWVVYYIPSEDGIFEAQVDDTAATLTVGEAQDILATAGSTTTGISAHEINGDALTNDGDVAVVEIPDIVGNDPTLAFGRYWVKFVNTQFNNV